MADILDSIDEIDDDFDFNDTEVLTGEVVDDDTETSDEVATVASEMDETEALEVTEAIRSAATATYALLLHAHQGKAYKALGYKTWADYVNKEFDMSAQRSYQLLHLGEVISEIEAVVPEGTVIKLTEAQARDIRRELPKITQSISESTREKTPEEAAEEVDRMVDEIREQKKLEEKTDSKKKEKEEADAQDEYQKNLEAAANALLEENGDAPDEDTLDADRVDTFTGSADDGLMSVAVDGNGDEGMSSGDSVHLYNFFNLLETVDNLPEPDEFIDIIPSSRADEVNKKLLDAAQWLNRLQTLWEAREGL